jgi:RNA polymerase sigma-70 factor (ECF subfamily)
MSTTLALAAPHTARLRTPRPAPAATGAVSHVLDASALGDHIDRLMRAALALCGSRADAEDLVQEVCLRVLAKPRVVRGSDIAYLHGVLRNTFITEHQARARRRTTPVEPSDLAHIAAGRRCDPELGALAGEVHEAISALPPHYRDAVVAVDVLGMAYAEAGAALEVPEGTIMSRLSRGRALVARQVGAPAAA